jgi:peptidoglycan/xylan/chitin deacetylase (PgdA/CDA1 family)
MKRLILRLLLALRAELLFRAAVNARRGPVLRILCGHRVIDESAADDPDDRRDLARGCLSLAQFRARIPYLRRHYIISDLPSCVGRPGAGIEPANALALTFDDGYADIHRNAWPEMKRLRVPFTVFVTTGRVDRGARMLTAAQIREMAADPLVSWGAHGVSHRPLTDMPAEEALREILESRSRLEDMTGVPVRLFAYPDGKLTDELKEAVKAAGFAGACATGRDINRGTPDRLALKRIPFEGEPFARFAWRVAGLT